MFPFVWKSYNINDSTTEKKMIGKKGAARNDINPMGYIYINGELWKAELSLAQAPIVKGENVKVIDMKGLTLIIEADIQYNPRTDL